MKKTVVSLVFLLGILFSSIASFADAQWCMNKARGEVWYKSSVTLEFGTNPPWWSFGIGWSSMICCVDGTDMDMCNYSAEDDECQRRVVRGICHPAPL